MLGNCTCPLLGGMHADGDAASTGSRDIAVVTENDFGGTGERGGVAEPAPM